MPSVPLTAGTLGQALAALQPEGAIVVDEARPAGSPTTALWGRACPRLLALTGGAIGQPPAASVAAALACPDRKVIAFQADGSGMYTLQSLWTCARESLDVIVGGRGEPRLPDPPVELARAVVAEPGPQRARSPTSPTPRSTGLARARMGVPGSRADTAEDFIASFRAARRAGPRLIEAVLA